MPFLIPVELFRPDGRDEHQRRGSYRRRRPQRQRWIRSATGAADTVWPHEDEATDPCHGCLHRPTHARERGNRRGHAREEPQQGRSGHVVAAGAGCGRCNVVSDWALSTVQGRPLVLHEGGTGGFSSLVAFDPAARKGVVMLADTALADLGGLGDAALPLLVDVPMGTPRRTLPTPADLLRSVPGDYELTTTRQGLKLWAEEGQLKVQAAGQASQTLGYDSRGDFYPLGASYLLRPLPGEGQGGRVDRLLLRQGGGAMEAVRVDAVTRLSASNPAWQPFAGEYALAPQFAIRVFEEAGQLKVQGTGQRPIAAEQTGPDRIEIKAVGAVIEFQRNEAQEVVSATLRQGGQTLTGAKKR